LPGPVGKGKRGDIDGERKTLRPESGKVPRARPVMVVVKEVRPGRLKKGIAEVL